MELRKGKVMFFLFFVTCTVVIAWYFYNTIKRPQNGYNINNQIHLKASSQNRENNGNVSQEITYSNNTEQRRIAYGIQMDGEQIRRISKTLPEKGNLLVWGLGNYSPYWHNSTKGRVVFIEDDIPLRKEGIMWYDKIVKQYSYLEVYRVHYTTNTVESFMKYINSPEIWFELDLSNQLPASVTRTHWHVIIIDAPLGCCQKGPGRYQSIYTSRVLGSKGTHVFVDDFERKVEHEFSIKVFGKPEEVVQRRTTNASLVNEQAHFILISYNQTRMGQGKETKPDILITPVLDIADNVTNNWTILLTVNNGFFDFFENWLWHFKKLDISVPVSVVAEDNIVFEKLTYLNDSSIKVHRSEHISINKAVKYNSTLYNMIVSARPTYILMYLKNGTNVIYIDLDTVWLQNPLPFLQGNFDIKSQLDLKDNFCTGFLAIKSNKDTIEFIQKWEDALRDKPNLNQDIFNRLVIKSPVNIVALNSKRFPSGNQYFNLFSKEERLGVVVVHNNWIIGHDKKVKRFQNMNLWHVKGKSFLFGNILKTIMVVMSVIYIFGLFLFSGIFGNCFLYQKLNKTKEVMPLENQ